MKYITGLGEGNYREGGITMEIIEVKMKKKNVYKVLLHGRMIAVYSDRRQADQYMRTQRGKMLLAAIDLFLPPSECEARQRDIYQSYTIEEGSINTIEEGNI